MLSLLNHVTDIAVERTEHLDIEGHTDDLPISNAKFPSNWELSSARAGTAARYLIGRDFPPSRVRAVGYADTKPVAPNDSAENRARNRRVEFVFLRVEDDTTSVPDLFLGPAKE